MFKLVPALMGQMSQAFPELLRAQVLITEPSSLRRAALNVPWTVV